MTQLKDPAQQQKIRDNQEAQSTKKALQQANRNLKILSDAGVRIALGTDSGINLGQWQGYFEHTEMETEGQGGVTPSQRPGARTAGGPPARTRGEPLWRHT